MAEPIYAPEYIFSTAAVTQEIPCFYCQDFINPVTDSEYFIAAIPMKNEALQFHIKCFEEFAWLMFTYFHHYVHRNESEILIN